MPEQRVTADKCHTGSDQRLLRDNLLNAGRRPFPPTPPPLLPHPVHTCRPLLVCWADTVLCVGLLHESRVESSTFVPPRWPSGQGIRLESGRSGVRIDLATEFFRVKSYQ